MLGLVPIATLARPAPPEAGATAAFAVVVAIVVFGFDLPDSFACSRGSVDCIPGIIFLEFSKRGFASVWFYSR